MAQFSYPLKTAGVIGHKQGYYPDALTQLVDSFEDNEIAEYTVSKGNAGTVTKSTDGSYAIELQSKDNNVYSASGLNAYPSAGDTFEYYQLFEKVGADGGIRFRWCYDHANGTFYGVGFNTYNDELRLYSDAGVLSSATYTGWTTGIWYRIEVSHGSDGSISVTIEDDTGSTLASLSATDTSYTSGGIAFNTWCNNYIHYAHFDGIRIL